MNFFTACLRGQQNLRKVYDPWFHSKDVLSCSNKLNAKKYIINCFEKLLCEFFSVKPYSFRKMQNIWQVIFYKVISVINSKDNFSIERAIINVLDYNLFLFVISVIVTSINHLSMLGKCKRYIITIKTWSFYNRIELILILVAWVFEIITITYLKFKITNNQFKPHSNTSKGSYLKQSSHKIN